MSLSGFFTIFDRMKKPLILISACLAGLHCRYDSTDCSNAIIQELLKKGEGIVVCPEQLGGLPTPRAASQIVGGDGFDVLSGKAKVISEEGKDVTEQFIMGAKETLRLAQLVGAKRVIFKERSPSCGVHKIYKGEKIVAGCGVTTALLLKKGFEVTSIEE